MQFYIWDEAGLMQFYTWDERFGSSCLPKSLHWTKLWAVGQGGRRALKSGWVSARGVGGFSG